MVISSFFSFFLSTYSIGLGVVNRTKFNFSFSILRKRGITRLESNGPVKRCQTQCYLCHCSSKVLQHTSASNTSPNIPIEDSWEKTRGPSQHPQEHGQCSSCIDIMLKVSLNLPVGKCAIQPQTIYLQLGGDEQWLTINTRVLDSLTNFFLVTVWKHKIINIRWGIFKIRMREFGDAYKSKRYQCDGIQP